MAPPPFPSADGRDIEGECAHARPPEGRWRLPLSPRRDTSIWGRAALTGTCTSRPRTPSCCWTLWSGMRPSSGRRGTRGQAAVGKAGRGTCRNTALSDSVAAGGARVFYQKTHPEFSVFRIDICLEIGSGSGVVSAFLASIIGASALYL